MRETLLAGLLLVAALGGASTASAADWAPAASATVPGDSGSGFMDDQGNAFGVLSTLQLAPIVASNGVSDLRKMLQYARSHGGRDVTLAAGTEPFTGSIIG